MTFSNVLLLRIGAPHYTSLHAPRHIAPGSGAHQASKPSHNTPFGSARLQLENPSLLPRQDGDGKSDHSIATIEMINLTTGEVTLNNEELPGPS